MSELLKREMTVKGCARLKGTIIRLLPVLSHTAALAVARRLRPAALLIALLLLALLSAPAPLLAPARANPSLPGDLSYGTETTWILPSLPNLSAAAAYIPHNFSHGEAVFQLEGEVIHGFRPGKEYDEMYIRDIAWGMETAQFYYPDSYLREPVEAFLRRQYTADTRSLDGDFGVLAGEGAVPGIITEAGESNKQTITSDEETSLIHAAYLYYDLTHDAGWLQQPIDGRSLIGRLNLAAEWLVSRRLDAELQLLRRGHTTDWGDVKFEASANYTDYDPEQDHLTASIYDQSLAYLAWRELADMNEAVGDSAAAEQWRARAEALKQQANARLWQPGRGFYLTHLHVTPLEHPFDEAAMVSISNALAIYAGLADAEQSRAILHNLERARLAAKADKPGLSIYPYYPNQWPDLFFDYLGMGYGNYQNGGVWDWWGGVQIKTEFLGGFSEEATAHLLQVAHDWSKHPGNIIEWQSTTDPAHHEGSHYYSAAAGTMGSAIIEGFFGIDMNRAGLALQPRLGLNDGFIRVYQPATDRYAAYTYDWDQHVIKIDYGTNVPEPITLKVLQSEARLDSEVRLDGQAVEFGIETIGDDSYLVFFGPGGQHSVEITRAPAPVQEQAPVSPPAPVDITSAAADEQPAAAGEASVEDRRPGSAAVSQPGEDELPAPPHAGAGTGTTAVIGAWTVDLAMARCASGALVIFSALGLVALILLRPRRR
jgi:hypothetical protein